MNARPHDPEFEAWVAEARAGSFETAAALCGFTPAKGQGKGADQAGPCPACGGRDRFAVNHAKRKFNCRHCGAKGADALALALVGEKLPFVDACEALTGQRRPDRIRGETPEEKSAREARNAARKAEADRDAAARAEQENQWRAREIDACARIWAAGQPPSERIALAYLKARGLELPASALIREIADFPFFHGEEEDGRGGKRPVCIWRGPAMLARMVDAGGAECGLHITWLAHDLQRKAQIFDPETGEALNPKKMRGSKKGARIVLRQPAAPRRLIIGEGIETTLTPAVALRQTRRLRETDAFWAAGDLGNLGGPHAATVAHPTLRTPGGRPQRVPGPEPAEGRCILIPEGVEELILLGDGDSDPFATRQHLERAARRHARPGLTIRQAWAPEGSDFNDVLTGRGA